MPLTEPPRSDQWFLRFAVVGWALTLLNSAVLDKLVLLTSHSPSMTARVAGVASWNQVHLLIGIYVVGALALLPMIRCTLVPFRRSGVRLLVRVFAVVGCMLIAAANLWQITEARRVDAGPLFWVYGHQILEVAALAAFLGLWHNEQQLRRERDQ